MDPGTRTSVTVKEKKTARRAAERESRRLARIIQATDGITPTQKVSLGLTPRESGPTPIPPPTEPPTIYVDLLYGSTVRVKVRGEDSTRRGKPAGVAGAMVLSYVGEQMPADVSQWCLAGNTTRPNIDVTIGGEITPGAKVWITAYWYNARAQRGPAARPRYTYLQCPTLWFEKDELRQAA